MPSFEPPPSSRAEFTTEAELAEPFPDVAEAEVGADLTAGLLAAGAAMAWLRRRTMKRDDEDS